jgi:hypothetical protein
MGASGIHMYASNGARRIRAFLLAGIALLVLGLGLSDARSGYTWDGPSAQATDCQSGIGGRLFSNGGEAEVELLAADAGFTIELYLMSPGPRRFIATNRDAGTIVKLGSLPDGVEFVFGILVRETQQTYLMGAGSGNPDGLPHDEVTCFGGGRSNVGFEDQLGGGDRDYNDLMCTVRQPKNSCTYSVNPRSQSFDAGGGGGTLSVGVQSGCSWTTKSNVSWIVITSGGSGSDNGTVRYSVAANPETSPRAGTLTVQGETFTVSQDAAGAQPVITSALRKSEKKIFIYGINFDGGSVILLNGEDQKTIYDGENPRTVLIGKKLGRWAQPGDKLRVRSSAGVLSPEYIYAP